MKVYGIDVSHHQGAIDWQQTAAELRRVNNYQGPGFAILRAGYSSRTGQGGLIKDSQIGANIKGCEAQGIPMGIYVYSYDTSPGASAITARTLLEVLRGHKFDYPIYLDVEYEPWNTGRDGSGRSPDRVKADNTAVIQAFLQVLEAAGYYAAVYCSRDFFMRYTNLEQLKAFDKWEAAYTPTDTGAVPNGCWQYSSSNPLGIAGFGKSLDCDVAYKDYPSIMRSAKLNGYQEQVKLYKITTQASAGDKDRILALFEELGLAATVEAY